MGKSIGMGKTVSLAIGEEFHLKRGKDRIVYAGMLSEEIYSIVQKNMSGNQGYAWNLFFPKRRRDIIIDGVELYIDNITPDEIMLHLM